MEVVDALWGELEVVVVQGGEHTRLNDGVPAPGRGAGKERVRRKRDGSGARTPEGTVVLPAKAITNLKKL